MADTSFNDRYFPRVDISDKSRYEYYKYGKREFAYDKKDALVIWLFKDDEEVQEMGDKAPYREMDAVGLSRDHWKDKEVRDEYLWEFCQDLDEEEDYMLQDFIDNELPYYQKDESLKRYDEEDYRQHYLDRRARVKQKKLDNANNIVKQIRNSDDPIEEAFRLLVPAEGAADTVGGEYIRAMMKILYRDWNDGDVFYEGYGIETCGAAVAYLCDKIDLIDMFDTIVEGHYEDERYTSKIKAIANVVLSEIYKNPELVVERNTDDYLDYDGEAFIEEMGWEPMYDFETDFPDNVQYHLDRGDISERDIQWEIENWEYCGRAGDIRINNYGVTLYDLKKDDYEVIDNEMDTWLYEYGEELDSEYGSEEENEEEDEENEEDDE